MCRSIRFTDNRGLSLVELIVVIAIMAVLIGGAGFGLSMLVGTEAKRAVNRMEAQLNDVKTGTLTKAGEDLLIRYINVPKKGESGYETWATQGVEISGFYADKCIYTLVIDSSTAKDKYKEPYSDNHDYSFLSARRVDISVFYDGTEFPLKPGTDSAVKITFKRDDGSLLPVEVGSSDEDGNFIPDKSGKIEKITFKVGLREYVMNFEAETGTYTIE